MKPLKPLRKFKPKYMDKPKPSKTDKEYDRQQKKSELMVFMQNY